MSRSAAVSRSAAFAALFAMSAAAAVLLPDGEYYCSISTMHLGDIRIADGRFAGPAYDGEYGEDYPFTVDGLVIHWGGPLGGVSDAGEVVSTVLKKAGDSVGFDITIKNARGNFQTVSCSPK